MPEDFCKLEPDFESGKRFIELVKSGDSVELDGLLAGDERLRENIDSHWFYFDAPAIVQAKHDLATVDVLLKHGAKINERSSWWAGSFGILDGVNRKTFDALVARGAEIGINNAAEQGDLDLVRQMLSADPSAANRPAGDGQRPLHVAATPAIAELLLQNGAEIDARDIDHFATPAQYQVGRPEVCRYLISRGAEPDIFMACALGDLELVQQILSVEPDALATRMGGCKHTRRPNDEYGDGHIYIWGLKGAQTPLEVARAFGHKELYKVMFNLSAPPQRYIAALWDADRQGVAKILSVAPNVFQQIPEESKNEMARAAWEGKLEVVKLMFEQGFDPHLTQSHDSTPLDRAAFHGYREIVQFLLDNDPDPPLTVKNEFGGTPLGTCIYGSVHSWIKGTDHAGTVRALIAAGASFDRDWIPTENPAMDALLMEYLEG